MNSLERLCAFEDVIKTCKSQEQLIGTGNPLAPILVIGKESAYKAQSKEEIKEHIKGNIKAVENCFYNGDLVNLYLQGHPQSHTHTWNVYQKLFDYIIYENEQQRGKGTALDFGTWGFFTEMNNTASPKTADAERNLRIEMFKHPFFRDFSVVILACSNYIINQGDKRQIDETFAVRYDKERDCRIGGPVYEKGQWFYTHHSEDGKRLVIHTRQLSQYYNDLMLQDMAKIVRWHLLNSGKFPNHIRG